MRKHDSKFNISPHDNPMEEEKKDDNKNNEENKKDINKNSKQEPKKPKLNLKNTKK